MKKTPFIKYELSSESLAKLTSDQRAMFGALTLALSEIEALRSVVEIAPVAADTDPDVKSAIIDRQQVFYRLIVMKVLEVFKTLSLSGKQNRTDDSELMRFRNEVVSRTYKELKQHPGFKGWQKLRDKMGFHYDLNFFLEMESLDGLNYSGCALANEELNFHSFPFGEFLLTAGLGAANGSFSLEVAQKEFRTHGQFLSVAINCFSKVFSEFFQQFVKPYVRGTEVRKSLPPKLVVRDGEVYLPLIVLKGSACN